MKLQVKLCTDKDELIDVRELIKGIDYKVIGRRNMVLLKSLLVIVDGDRHSIPAHYEWNGASIPRVFWYFIGKPTIQDFALASVVHDYFYEIHHDRDEADTTFRKLLDWAGVNGRRVALMWAAVRVAGWWFYINKGEK
jgi:hypothetical protein